MNRETSLVVSIVTWNDGPFLVGCLESLRTQSVGHELVVYDNASRDRSAEIALDFGARVHHSSSNDGFSKGHNCNLRGCGHEFFLLLNADVRLRPNFLEALLEACRSDPEIGMAGGKLLRIDSEGREMTHEGRPVLDSTGIFFTPTGRHFDRGSNEADTGRYDRRQLVFGITGAAVLCRRAMVDDLTATSGEFLDEDFFAYREDADLAWRAQMRGWKAVYEPRALAGHYRKVFPKDRSSVPALVNYHSVKNRFLMRAKNMDWRVSWRCFPHMWIRDVGIVLYILARERSSLAALSHVWRLRPRMLEKRRAIQRSRKASPAEIAWWFAFQPRAIDV